MECSDRVNLAKESKVRCCFDREEEDDGSAPEEAEEGQDEWEEDEEDDEGEEGEKEEERKAPALRDKSQSEEMTARERPLSLEVIAN